MTDEEELVKTIKEDTLKEYEEMGNGNKSNVVQRILFMGIIILLLLIAKSLSTTRETIDEIEQDTGKKITSYVEME